MIHILMIAVFLVYIIANYFHVKELRNNDYRYFNNKIIDVQDSIPGNIKEYLQEDEAMIIIYTLIALRAEFLYNLSRKIVEDPPTVQWHYDQEKDFLTRRLSKLWPDKKEDEIIELVNNFYK